MYDMYRKLVFFFFFYFSNNIIINTIAKTKRKIMMKVSFAIAVFLRCHSKEIIPACI